MGLQDKTRKRVRRRSRKINHLTSVLLVFLGCKFAEANFGFAPKTRLTWVNGIGYNEEHMEKEAPVIAKFFGGKKVEFYHNPTKMVDEKDTKGYFSDLTQAGSQKYLGRITSEVNGLVEHLKAAVRSVEKQNGIVVHIAHSQGALVTSLAAKQLTPIEMSKIEVICFGGATPVRSTPETPFRRCINYYSVNDPLLFLNPSAESALRSGFNHHYYSSDNNKANEDEFCFLAPRIGDPIADHMLLGPTYASALEWEGKRFERKYQTYLQRTTRFALITSLSILTMLFQFFSLILEKLVVALLEFGTRLRRALVLSLAAKINTIRSLIIAVLARVVAFVRSLFQQLQTAPTETPPNLEESVVEASTSKTSLLDSNPSSSNSTPKTPTETAPMTTTESLFGSKRKTEESQVAIPEEEEAASIPPTTISQWISLKTKKQQ